MPTFTVRTADDTFHYIEASSYVQRADGSLTFRDLSGADAHTLAAGEWSELQSGAYVDTEGKQVTAFTTQAPESEQEPEETTEETAEFLHGFPDPTEAEAAEETGPAEPMLTPTATPDPTEAPDQPDPFAPVEQPQNSEES